MRRLLLRSALLRRLISIPALLVMLGVTAALTVPVVVLGGPLALRRGGRGRAVRIALFALSYLCVESAGLLGAAWLWVRSGCGRHIAAPRWQEAHYVLLAGLLRRLYRVGGGLFALHVNEPATVTDAAASPALPRTPGRPLLVFSRHAGPGDSFLLVYALLALARRRPRIVLKEALRFDPLIDVLLGRLPHCFVGPGPQGGDRAAAQIARICAAMGPADALLVFPEGGNFTPHRRLRAIASLRRRGLRHASARARRLRNVLPPQPAGVFAAVDAAPHADMVFVAHTGLDHIQSARQLWRGIPLERAVDVTWWTIPTERVPLQQDARLRWLHGNWAEVDAWIGRAQPTETLS
jgi:1-acyl-sn-glycerol-3-phosphate acyltransferase